MDNFTIAKALNTHYVTKLNFKGCYSSDEIEKLNKKVTEKNFYIINLDKSNEPGSHWICIMLTPLGKNYFFDSYGMPPYLTEFKKFMNDSYQYNKICLQHHLSTSCGQWCMYFIFHKCLNLPLKVLFDKFNKRNKLKNDTLVVHIVNHIFKLSSEPVSKIFMKKQLCKKQQRSQPMKNNLKKIEKAAAETLHKKQKQKLDTQHE